MPGKNLNLHPLPDSIITFAGILRTQGFHIGVQESQDAILASSLGIYRNRKTFKYSLAAIFCQNSDERKIFETVFEKFWNQDGLEHTKNKKRMKVDRYQTINQPRSIVMLGQGKSDQTASTGESVSGANAIERLRKTDFSKLSETEYTELDEIAQRLFRQLSKRLSRRFREKDRRGILNFALTQRKNLQKGGDPIFLEYRSRVHRKPRIIVLLDVSGSMDKYSFYLLKFLFALQQCFEKMESFIFSTRLVRITEILQKQGLDKCLRVLSDQTDNWSSGTMIGECLADFNAHFAGRVLNSNTTTIILSDGLDTGESNTLKSAIKKIQRRGRTLVWLNPLKGMEGYAPEAKGMKVALPYVDRFSSAHNLDSLLELESILTNA